MTWRFKPLPRPDWAGMFSRGSGTPTHIKVMEESFLSHVDTTLPPRPSGADSYEWYLANCQVWRGPMSSSGAGRFLVNRAWMPVQEYVLELHTGRPLSYQSLVMHQAEATTVARCLAANTRNCVHRDHLGLVVARRPFWKETTLELRDSIRYHHAVGSEDRDNWVSSSNLAIKFRMNEGRVCRILTYLEGPADSRKIQRLPPVATNQ